MKRNRCVLIMCVLLILSLFSFIQAPSENFALHEPVYSDTKHQKVGDSGQVSVPEIQALAKNPTTLVCFFSHGIADTYRQAQKYVHQYEDNGKIHTNPRYTIAVPTRAFNYPDATQRFWRVNFWRTNLGQDADVLTLKRALERLKEQNPSIEVILYGVSRGASTIINFLAQYSAEIYPAPFDTVTPLDTLLSQNSGRTDQQLRVSGKKQDLSPKFPEKTRGKSETQADTVPRIRAVVLESPYDDIASVARYLSQRTYIDTLPYGRDYGHQAVHSIIRTIFINYNKNGLSPIKSAHKVPKNIPILIICSEQDQLVPWHSSYNLYQKLKNTGHEHAHVLRLQKGQHAKLLSGPEGDRYQHAVHSFYKQYGLPYNQTLLHN